MSDHVLARYLTALVDTLAEDYGLDRAAVYEAAGVEPLSAGGGQDRVPGSVADALWRAAESLTGDEALGLKVGTRVRYSSYATLGHLLTTCDTVGESLKMACGYATYVGTGGLFDMKDEGGDMVLTYRPVRPEWPAGQIRSEAVLLPFVRFANWAAEGVRPAEIYLCRERADNPQVFEEAFLAPVRFGAGHNSIRWQPEALAHPMADANRALKDVLRAHVLADLPTDTDTVARVSGYLSTRLSEPLGLGGSDALLKACAGELGLSVRSLQRELAGSGQSFRSLLADARKLSAQKLLRESDASVADIAEHLGYSEPAAFVRAFGRWCGTSPARYRRG
ncbi:AraC family transcriptional regulator [Kordiimonas marina]|uniref:AraC family transcriptional regulator n=1 Tax=Kordiimonas marina TaxID=2872312 RepID=UPI001FF1011C|nr:AraC family transcriptional regulator [Kordiimonas marina]MCJ9427727.1 AraC family transcriptional regulator [Kordiimonas marina]